MQHQPLPPLFVASPILPAVVLGVDQALLLAVIRHIDACHHAACASYERAVAAGDAPGQDRTIGEITHLTHLIGLCYELYHYNDHLRAN